MSNDSIKIGENVPFTALAVCKGCGEETGELLILGCGMKFECRDCGLVSFGMVKCLEGGLKHKGTKSKMEHSDKVPYGRCEACTKQAQEHLEIVSAGGVYFQCEDCGSEGVIKKCEFTDAAREELDTPAPDPIGIRLNKNICPACREPEAQEPEQKQGSSEP